MKSIGFASGVLGALGVVVACGGEPSPADNCNDFLDLTADCAAKAGKQLPTNSAACDDPQIAESRTQAQMVCALQNQPAYCATIVAALNGSANAQLATDPAILKLNACIGAYTAAEPCKGAILALADCGAAIALAGGDTCTGQVEVLARCVVENKAGACSLYKPNRAPASGLTADEQAFQTCLQKASQVDAGRD